MIPIEMPKYRFAMRLYGIRDKKKAAQKLLREYRNSPMLQKKLSEVGYRPMCRMLRRADLKVFHEVLELPDDFWEANKK